MTGIFDTNNIPEGEPSEMTAGTLVRWRRTDLSIDYDPTLYDLKYSYRRMSTATNVEIEITATSDATGFYVDQASANGTEDWEAGSYRWQAYIVRQSDSEKVLIDSGRATVVVNLDIAVDGDLRSHAEKMVQFLEAAIESRAGSDVIYYQIGGRAVSKIPPKELRALLADYRNELSAEIAAERRKSGAPNSNSITVRFS